MYAVHPIAVEKEAERCSQRKPDDVGGDIVCEQTGEAEQVVTDPQTADSNEKAADGDKHVLDKF